MFYSQFILAKKGPLGTIWIAAHLERKLRKNQVADTDIGVSVGKISIFLFIVICLYSNVFFHIFSPSLMLVFTLCNHSLSVDFDMPLLLMYTLACICIFTLLFFEEIK